MIDRYLREARILRHLALYLVLFFGWALAVYVFRWEATLVGVFWELLIIPSLAALVILPVFTLVRLVQTEAEVRRAYLGVLLLLIVPIALVVLLIILG